MLGRAHGVARNGEDLGGQSPNDGVFRICCFLLCCVWALAASMPKCQGVTMCAVQASTWPAMVGITPRGAPRLLLQGGTTWAWLSVGAIGSLGDTSRERPCMWVSHMGTSDDWGGVVLRHCLNSDSIVPVWPALHVFLGVSWIIVIYIFLLFLGLYWFLRVFV